MASEPAGFGRNRTGEAGDAGGASIAVTVPAVTHAGYGIPKEAALRSRGVNSIEARCSSARGLDAERVWERIYFDVCRKSEISPSRSRVANSMAAPAWPAFLRTASSRSRRVINAEESACECSCPSDTITLS
jgi:hypothetical protein